MTTIAKKLTIPTAAIKAAALAKQSARPVRLQRVGLLSAARKAVDTGKLPPLLKFTSAQNLTYNRHTEAMYALAKAGDRKALMAYCISGTNTYAKAARGYQELLVEAVKPAKAKPATKAAKSK